MRSKRTDKVHKESWQMKKRLYRSYICENKEIVKDIFFTTFKIADVNESITIQAGQFLHLLCPDFPQFHLRRPFTIFDYSFEGNGIKVSILYEVIGRITHYLASTNLILEHSKTQKSKSVELLMPLGNPFTIMDSKRIVFVAGGIGIAAFGLLKKNIKNDVVLLYGARSKESLIDSDLFKSSFSDIKYTTDDGSIGTKGFVTLLLHDDLKKYGKQSAYYICGPEQMMIACFKLLKKYNAIAQFSLENKMACALNVCRACVVKVKNNKGFRMATCCTEGPNFSIDKLPDHGWW